MLRLCVVCSQDGIHTHWIGELTNGTLLMKSKPLEIPKKCIRIELFELSS